MRLKFTLRMFKYLMFESDFVCKLCSDVYDQWHNINNLFRNQFYLVGFSKKKGYKCKSLTELCSVTYKNHYIVNNCTFQKENEAVRNVLKPAYSILPS